MARFPMNLQLFAGSSSGAAGGSGAEGAGGDAVGAAGGEPGQQSGAGTGPQFDYEKLASRIAGKTSVTEDTVLKSYFKQQGLSQEEMAQAIQAFKAQKAASQPDVGALQSQAVGQDGKVNTETVTNALKKTLEDVPGLKPQASGQNGFIQVGAAGNGNQHQGDDAALKAAFGLK